MSDGVQLVTFWVDGAEYAVPVARVHEVVRVDAITRVPSAPAHVRGLTTHRGRMIPVLDLAPRRPGRDRMVTVEVGQRLIGLLVDRTAAVITAPVDSGSARDDGGDDRAPAQVGTATWEGRSIRVLDPDHLGQPGPLVRPGGASC